MFIFTPRKWRAISIAIYMLVWKAAHKEELLYHVWFWYARIWNIPSATESVHWTEIICENPVTVYFACKAYYSDSAVTMKKY